MVMLSERYRHAAHVRAARAGESLPSGCCRPGRYAA